VESNRCPLLAAALGASELDLRHFAPPLARVMRASALGRRGPAGREPLLPLPGPGLPGAGAGLQGPAARSSIHT